MTYNYLFHTYKSYSYLNNVSSAHHLVNEIDVYISTYKVPNCLSNSLNRSSLPHISTEDRKRQLSQFKFSPKGFVSRYDLKEKLLSERQFFLDLDVMGYLFLN